MAKKQANGSVNKSQAIKDLLKDNPGFSPKQVADELTAKGIDVSPAYVSTIKFNMKPTKAKSRRRKAAATPEASGALVPSQLIATKRLVDDVGSIEGVEMLLDTLKKLR